MPQFAVALALLCGAAGQSPGNDASAVLLDAAEAAQAVRTTVYNGRLELRSVASERLVTGVVRPEKPGYSPQIAGTGEIERASGGGKVY